MIYGKTESDPVNGWDTIQPTTRIRPQHLIIEERIWKVRDGFIDARVDLGQVLISTEPVMIKLQTVIDLLQRAAVQVVDQQVSFGIRLDRVKNQVALAKYEAVITRENYAVMAEYGVTSGLLHQIRSAVAELAALQVTLGSF